MSKNGFKDIKTYDNIMSENTLKEITPHNNMMSQNNMKNNLNYNIDYNNMSKNVKSKVEYLEGLAKKVKNENKNKADKLIQLHKDRKISQVTTAEKQILNFIEYNSAKDRRRKTINRNYHKIIAKYEEAEPLNERMSSNSKYLKSVEIKGEDKAKTEVIYHIRKTPHYEDGIKLFINVHNVMYKRLYKDVEKIVKRRNSSKIQTVCEYSYTEKKKIMHFFLLMHLQKWHFVHLELMMRVLVVLKLLETSLSSLDTSLQSQKMEVHEKILSKLDSTSISRVEKIIIVIYQTNKSRGSSYI
jgi:hypothetical protein